MRKEAEAWLKISAEDLQSAELLTDRKLFRPACYHAQQSVEKCLKALIVDRDIEIPRTHNILDLNNAAKKLGYSVEMFEVFLILATKASKKSITKDLANAAIQSYEAKKATFEANKVLGKI
jgi:HEPN domain-containing protein